MLHHEAVHAVVAGVCVCPWCPYRGPATKLLQGCNHCLCCWRSYWQNQPGSHHGLCLQPGTSQQRPSDTPREFACLYLRLCNMLVNTGSQFTPGRSCVVYSQELLSEIIFHLQGETGEVFYLTIDILETKCHVLSKKSYKDCESRNFGENPVWSLYFPHSNFPLNVI